MNSIVNLIHKLCPNGVKHIRLSEVGKICMCKRVLKSQTSKEGDVPFYKIGTFGGTADAYISKELFEEYKTKYSYPKKGDILISCSGTIGKSIIFDGEDSYFQDSNIVWVENDEKKVLNKFLYYYYQTSPWKVADGGTIKRLYNNNLERTVLPVPPLEVQWEIVHILDDFSLLSAELSAELKAREKQYDYYRDKLVSEGASNIKYLKLSDFAEIYDGTHQTPTYTEKGIKFISVENINNIYGSEKYISEDAYEKYKVKPKKNDLFMTRIGTIGKCAVFSKDEDMAFYVSLALIRPDNSVVNSKYLKYLIESKIGQEELRKRTLIHAVPTKINKNEIGKIVLPIPDLKQQDKIVEELDGFDKLVNDLIDGLPAEINARKVQYEYYRDKLLTL